MHKTRICKGFRIKELNCDTVERKITQLGPILILKPRRRKRQYSHNLYYKYQRVSKTWLRKGKLRNGINEYYRFWGTNRGGNLGWLNNNILKQFSWHFWIALNCTLMHIMWATKAIHGSMKDLSGMFYMNKVVILLHWYL